MMLCLACVVAGFLLGFFCCSAADESLYAEDKARAYRNGYRNGRAAGITAARVELACAAERLDLNAEG